jgi:hypothetical protein
MADVLDTAFDLDRPRSEAEWRELMTALARSLAVFMQREPRDLVIDATDDKPDAGAWSAFAHLRVLLSPAPLLEGQIIVGITVNVRKRAWITATVLMYADGKRIRGPGGKELFWLQFFGEWLAQGWTSDEFGEYESAEELPPLP